MPYSVESKVPLRSLIVSSILLAGGLGSSATQAAASPVEATIMATSPPMLHPIDYGLRAQACDEAANIVRIVGHRGVG
jgi:hypothetical protein